MQIVKYCVLIVLLLQFFTVISAFAPHTASITYISNQKAEKCEQLIQDNFAGGKHFTALTLVGDYLEVGCPTKVDLDTICKFLEQNGCLQDTNISTQSLKVSGKEPVSNELIQRIRTRRLNATHIEEKTVISQGINTPINKYLYSKTQLNYMGSLQGYFKAEARGYNINFFIDSSLIMNERFNKSFNYTCKEAMTKKQVLENILGSLMLRFESLEPDIILIKNSD